MSIITALCVFAAWYPVLVVVLCLWFKGATDLPTPNPEV